jgi:hypothetical protein
MRLLFEEPPLGLATRVNGISRIAGYLYSPASLSADWKPVW